MSDPAADPPAELTPDATALYARALGEGVLLAGREGLDWAPERIAAARGQLAGLRLLRPSGPGRWVPASPEAAAAELVGPLELEIRRRRLEAERTRTLLRPLRSLYAEAHRERGRSAAVELLPEVGQVRALLDEVSRSCAREVLVSQPEALEGATLLDSRPRDLDLLARGVRIRTLYPHVVLASPVVQRHFALMTEAGAEIRTTGEVVDRLIVFDRRIAFLPDRSRPGPPGALVVREPAAVDYLHRVLERDWDHARPFARTPLGYGDAADGVKRAIVRLLAAGHKDEAIAHRTNMSVRTCRRHIAELMREWGVESRFQAGVLAARLGLAGEEGGPS
ncbi:MULTISPECIES: putative LuxR family transcriptional regulator [Kitasatospora]|uniref:Putative LuxR family transcriptional regulator n=1 Tax=Kitasatospora setae (strain ATCC 33774 / DSM 43861 / JCM 3304 / KCC A-0304 / NBRC 14216 / KM-6054) TaxID=452652 RepID=E4MZG9_KITSK|nr:MULTISPECIES: putative LuxR family transcriptional regulator [Kitasatospora]BAJ29743.1 putative LuxR family transcriptional regulator [Kitasatospora setae KM-6054]